MCFDLHFLNQGSAKTKADAEKAFEDTMKLDGEVNGMMDQLTAAEKELEKKKAEADTDMMMASMVGHGLFVYNLFCCLIADFVFLLTLLFFTGI